MNPPSVAPQGTDPKAAALLCLALGWSVVPMQPHGKRPLIRWTPFQQQRATAEDVDHWFRH